MPFLNRSDLRKLIFFQWNDPDNPRYYHIKQKSIFFSSEKHFYWVLLTYSNLILERRLGRASSLLRRRKETLAWVYNRLFYPMIARQTFIKSCANIKIDGHNSFRQKSLCWKPLKNILKSNESSHFVTFTYGV